MFVPKDLANNWTDRVLLFWGMVPQASKEKFKKKYSGFCEVTWTQLRKIISQIRYLKQKKTFKVPLEAFRGEAASRRFDT